MQMIMEHFPYSYQVIGSYNNILHVINAWDEAIGMGFGNSASVETGWNAMTPLNRVCLVSFICFNSINVLFLYENKNQ